MSLIPKTHTYSVCALLRHIQKITQEKDEVHNDKIHEVFVIHVSILCPVGCTVSTGVV